MVGVSLRHQGAELLGQRGGITDYLAEAKTFGIPLLAPWANRLGGDEYTAGGRLVDVGGVPGVHRDGNGLPIHGLLGAHPGWEVTELRADADTAVLIAALEFDEATPQFPAFPFPHQLEVTVELGGSTLAVTTALTPRAEVPVPVAFGWHPYFTLPGVLREEWQVSLPFTSHVQLDAQNLPTGAIAQVPAYAGPLGDTDLDDLYTDVASDTRAWLSGGGRRITVTYASGYDYAVLYAPRGQALLAIEPMTAPTNPFSGPFDVQYATPGGRYLATFTIEVSAQSETHTLAAEEKP